MSKTILFSPVGGTDPISNVNGHDGSMLHICRCYRPDKVYLYMSKEILELHHKDDRYRYCLDKLKELTGWNYQLEIIERQDMDNVQEFDYFYRDFRSIIENILNEMDEDDELLLNISSGTPAMKSGLLVLKTLGEFPCKAIQTVTPAKRMNEHSHIGYNVEELWEMDDDNSEDFERRCTEVRCPTLSAIKQEEMIKKLVSEYSYQAAIEAAEMLPEDETAGYIELIRMASKRLLLDFAGVDRILKQTETYRLPVKDTTTDTRKLFEYALSLQIKLKKAEYADFVRALSPLFADLFDGILRAQCGINIYRDFCSKTEKDTYAWDEEKLRDTDILETLDNSFNGKFRYGNVESSHRVVLIMSLTDIESPVHMVTEKLRKVEEELRNKAAHEIISVTSDSLRSQTGLSGEEIMDLIKRAFTYAGFNIRKEYWDSYDDMNKVIIDRIAGIR